jgi:predicted phosphodiesterase
VRVRLGFLADVHGNRLALEAVLTHGHERGVEEWWVLGDLVAIGPEPVETLEVLAGLPQVRLVRGNTDRYVLTGDRPFPTAADVERQPSLQAVFDEVEASFAWTADQLRRSGWLSWLAQVPHELRRELPDGTQLVGLHASPFGDDDAGISPTTAEDAAEAMLDAAAAQLLVAGHTHRATDRAFAGGRVVNPGSVSNPITDDHRATYAVLVAQPNTFQLTFHRVAYDADAVIASTLRAGHPAARYICSFQRGLHARHAADSPGSPVWS